MPRELRLSIIICCYNAAQRLPKTFEHLGKQEGVLNSDWEVVLVDNLSTDQTISVAKELHAQFFPQVAMQCIEEKQQGLSYARKAGLYASQGKYILFCDDDNWLDPWYLSKSIEELDKDASLALLGGCAYAVFEKEKPLWFDAFEMYFAVGSQAKSWTIYGAGSVFRKQVLLLMYEKGFRSLLSDRVGNQLSSGGDIELSMAVQIMGYRVQGLDALTFGHFMPEGRCTKAYLKKLIRGIGNSDPALIPYRFKHSKIKRKSHQKHWLWNLIIYTYRSLILEKQWTWFLKTGFDAQMHRLYWKSYALGIFVKRETIRSGFDELENALWINQ